MNITYFHPFAEELVGIIPNFLFESDPRPAAEQFNERYSFGGGWRPMGGWTAVHKAPRSGIEGFHSVLTITYPGDPTYWPVAHITFRDQAVWIYQHAWVAVESADGSVEISRMD